MTKKKKEDEAFKFITDLIDDIFDDHYRGEAIKKSISEKKVVPLIPNETIHEIMLSTKTPPYFYGSIEEYTHITGKRFRMTKDQKARNLSREDAFNETFGEKN